jgi:DNA helicase-2/ATP-dependent DNA helicase PcrA
MSGNEQEHHIYGPPGTGKTTTVAKNVERAVEKYGPNKVMVSSHTRAAATELMGRGLSVNEGLVGTLHALCYRALGHPELAETHIDQWNEEHPYFRLSKKEISNHAQSVENLSDSSDQLLGSYNLHRARLLGRETLPYSIKAFADRWEDWKEANSYRDFTDLIQMGRDNFEIVPGRPDVIFIDEAQDLSALQFACISKWSTSCKKVVFIGDDDQAIYLFAGADARNLIDRPIPDQNRIILKQSYRLPRAVRNVSQKWIERCTHRQEKEFAPRNAEGVARAMAGTNWQDPALLIRDVIKTIEEGQTAMILGTCSYMLRPIIEAMRSEGILFHNPYKKERGDWNPYRIGATSTISKCLQYIRSEDNWSPHWNAINLHAWSTLVKATGVFKRGAKKVLDEIAKKEHGGQILLKDQLEGYLEDGPWFSSLDPWGVNQLSFLEENAVEAKRRTVQLACNAVRRQGLDRGFTPPKIIIGTVHSVKGAEADVVYLLPDMSNSAMENWHKGGDYRDAVRRTFYVGMTRARNELVIPDPGGPWFIQAPM